tara:strand:+ start:397 stop:567 length:171 start_codon:yes stop_codon:yes gene_type:complete
MASEISEKAKDLGSFKIYNNIIPIKCAQYKTKAISDKFSILESLGSYKYLKFYPEH